MFEKASTLLVRDLLAAVAGVLIFLPPLAVRGDTPSDLLQQGIYAEETAGNLDQAIKLYEQVIAESKSGRSAAAQAQFRLGKCYEKQGKTDMATKAFQTIIDDYPQEKKLVAEARKHLPAALTLLPSPWASGERLHMNMSLATGLEIGVMVYTIESGQEEGKDVWKISSRGLVTINGVDSISRVIVDKDSFAPIRSWWKHSLLGDATAIYGADNVDIAFVNKPEHVTITTDGPVFDNEQCIKLFRRLPLEIGYKTQITVLSSLSATLVPLGMEVTGKETIETPAGKFECYKLALNIGQTFWISTDEHRYLVRFDAGGVTAKLARVEVRQPAELEQVKGNGFSLELPAGWAAYQPKKDPKDKHEMTYLMDPDANAKTAVGVGPKAELDKAAQESTKAWTESYLKELGANAQNVKVRDPGLQEIKVGDRTGTMIVVDFTADGKPTTTYGVGVFGDEKAVSFRLTSPRDKFDTLKGDAEAIVKSLVVE